MCCRCIVFSSFLKSNIQEHGVRPQTCTQRGMNVPPGLMCPLLNLVAEEALKSRFLKSLLKLFSLDHGQLPSSLKFKQTEQKFVRLESPLL